MTARGGIGSADLVRLYLDDISRYPLLTRKDEERLGRRLIAGQEAARLLAEAGTRLPAARRRQLSCTVQSGEEAVQRLVESNLRLVVFVARRYQRSSLSLLDLIQEGNVGLLHAAQRYDYRRGFKFSTPAIGWIRQAIVRGIATKGRIIRLPLAMDRNLALVRQAQVNCQASEPPSVRAAHMAAETGLEADQIAEARRAGRDVLSLSVSLAEERNLSLADAVEDPLARVAFDSVEVAFVPSAVRRLLSVLTDREREVVRLRYGIDEPHRHTLDEVGERFHVSRERVRQIEARAIEKLVRPAARADIGLDALSY